MVQEISSLQNERVKRWKKLLTAKGRKKEQQYIIEGWHLVDEASQSNVLVECIMNKSAYALYGSLVTVPIYLITDDIVTALSETITPQSIFGIVRMPKTIIDFSKGKYMLLDAVQDPGNVGTIIRTADAAGFNGVIIGTGTVDIYNSKTIRSMQGSQFHLSVHKMDLLTAIQHFKAHNIVVYGTSLNGHTQSLFSMPNSTNCAIIVGNEGQGVSEQLLAQTDKNIFIDIIGQAESLNVAVAAGIIMYHFRNK